MYYISHATCHLDPVSKRGRPWTPRPWLRNGGGSQGSPLRLGGSPCSKRHRGEFCQRDFIWSMKAISCSNWELFGYLVMVDSLGIHDTWACRSLSMMAWEWHLCRIFAYLCSLYVAYPQCSLFSWFCAILATSCRYEVCIYSSKDALFHFSPNFSLPRTIRTARNEGFGWLITLKERPI